MYFELGLDLVASGFDFFGGGGIEYYRKNGVDIFKEAAGKGYTVLNGKSDLDSLRPGQKTIFLADAKDKKMSYAIDADPEVPTLAEITAGGIKVLDNPEGFFMMVEGGLIDYAGHGNDAAINVYEVLAFDEAVKVALDFYHKHPEETLIIVTGDHETGGMTLGCVSSTLNVKYFAHQKCSSAKVGSLVAEARKKEYNDLFCNPYNAAGYGYIDDIIEPRNTRFRIIRALEQLAAKAQENPWKKHDNLPL